MNQKISCETTYRKASATTFLPACYCQDKHGFSFSSAFLISLIDSHWWMEPDGKGAWETLVSSLQERWGNIGGRKEDIERPTENSAYYLKLATWLSIFSSVYKVLKNLLWNWSVYWLVNHLGVETIKQSFRKSFISESTSFLKIQKVPMKNIKNGKQLFW